MQHNWHINVLVKVLHLRNLDSPLQQHWHIGNLVDELRLEYLDGHACTAAPKMTASSGSMDLWGSFLHKTPCRYVPLIIERDVAQLRHVHGGHVERLEQICSRL